MLVFQNLDCLSLVVCSNTTLLKLQTWLFLLFSKFCTSKSGVQLIYGCGLYTDICGNIMFYHMVHLGVREKTSQNKGCDWLSVDSPLLKMCRSQNRIHSNVSACIMTCLFFPWKGGTSWLLQMQTRVFPRILRLIIP